MDDYDKNDLRRDAMKGNTMLREAEQLARELPRVWDTLSLLHQQGPAKSILVVDDEQATRKAIALVMVDEGYTVLQASNGAEALAVLRAVAGPLVVLLDWMMPVMDGLELLRTVATEPGSGLGRHAYVFMSDAFPAGLSQVAALPKTLRISILIKPFTIALLMEKVAEAAASAMQHERSEFAGGNDAEG